MSETSTEKRPARILIVEDNATNLELMTYLLNAAGYTTMATRRGEEGLEIARNEVPDLVICDIYLPGIDGCEVARRLKKESTQAVGAIPLVAVTALALEGDRERLLEAGFDCYVSKPIVPETLVEQIEAFLPESLRAGPQAAAARSGEEAAMPGAPQAATVPNRGTILVVDDFDLELALMQSVLEPAGYEVVTATAFTEALDVARRRPPDLIVSDVRMPGGTGYDLLDALKADAQLQRIPVMMITSMGLTDEDKQAAYRRGALRQLSRPMRPQTLLAEVQACLTEARVGRRGHTILVVDDRASNRQIFTSLLANAGDRVLEACDGVEALDVARRERPDLIIADIVMPNMDGYELVRRLRIDPEIAHTPVIFYTSSYLESEARKLADACGVRFIITKPCEPQEILDKVHAVLCGNAPEPAPAEIENFEKEHLFVLTNKLSQKVDELEGLNAQLERRVEQRTAELALANVALRESNRRKDEMVAIVSHDLRSPLTGILMVTDLLQRDTVEKTREDQARLLDIVRGATDRMIAMVNDLLHAAKTGAGAEQLELQEVRVSETIRHSIEPLAIHANAKNIALGVEIVPGEPVLRADRVKVSQIFNNLLSNAVKFTPPGGRVFVKVEPVPRGVNVSVSDTGAGIPQDELSAIFEKYHQASPKATAGEPGSGLGLAIVRHLVALHNGRIEVSSAPGRGSTFEVFLPLNPMGNGE